MGWPVTSESITLMGTKRAVFQRILVRKTGLGECSKPGGGGRSKGWGQIESTEFQAGVWPALLLPKLGRLLRNAPESDSKEAASLYWLLSLYSPASADQIDWSGGNYSLVSRGGRVESHSGHGAAKKTVRLVNEGCVLASPEEPIGVAVDVAPDGFAHPVYRSGLALALRLPVVEVQPQDKTSVEEPSTVEAVMEEEPAKTEPVEPSPAPVAETPAAEEPAHVGRFPEPAVEEPAPTPPAEEPSPAEHPVEEPAPVQHPVEEPPPVESPKHEEEPPHEL